MTEKDIPRLQVIVENEAFASTIGELIIKMLREGGLITVGIQILAREGEEFTHPEGEKATVPQGHTYVAVEHSLLRLLGSIDRTPQPPVEPS